MTLEVTKTDGVLRVYRPMLLRKIEKWLESFKIKIYLCYLVYFVHKGNLFI